MLFRSAGAGFFQKGRGQAIRTSGFSQTVDLGVIGSVKLDPTVVMRVQFPEQTGPSLGRVYLRGAAYDRYTGRTWINSLAHRHAVRQRRMGTFTVSDVPRSTLAKEGMRQEILIEALDAPVLFGVPREILAAAIFGVASMTDWLDGYLARRRLDRAGALAIAPTQTPS